MGHIQAIAGPPGRVSQGYAVALPLSSRGSPIRDPAVTSSQKAAPPPPSLALDQVDAVGKLRPG